MENIDDLMRQKFDSDDPGERFEFQEEYWEQAQALLEKEEEKRRRWLWWFFLLLAGTGLCAWFLLARGNGDSLSQNQTKTVTTIVQDKNTGSEKENSAANTLSDKIADNKNTVNNPQNNAEKVEKSADNQIVNANKNKRESASKPSGNTRRETAHVSTNPVRDQQAGALTDKSGSQRTPKGQPDQQGRLTETAQTLNGTGTEGQQAGNNGTAIQNNASPGNPAPATPDGSGAAPSTENQPDLYPNIPMDLIPVFLRPLMAPDRMLVLPIPPVQKPAPIAENTKPIKKQRLVLGLSLEGSAYQANSWDTTSNKPGWSVGAFAGYRLSDNWSLRLGGAWRYMPGHGAMVDSVNLVSVSQLRYSFGYERETWKRDLQGLHYLEIPVSAQWQKGRFAVQGGTAADMLLFVQTSTEHTVETSLEPAVTSVQKWVKGGKTPYVSTGLAAFAGVEYGLTNWLSLSLKGQYRFTPVVKKAPDGVKNKGLGNADLGIKIRLF